MKTLIAAGSDKKIKEMEDNMVSHASSMADCRDMTFIHDQARALLLLSKHSITTRARATHLIRSCQSLCCTHTHTQGSGTQVSRELDAQVLITALALPNGGKILFAATETGVVRCYKYPLTGRWWGG
jgi:hypothetical protein